MFIKKYKSSKKSYNMYFRGLYVLKEKLSKQKYRSCSPRVFTEGKKAKT